MSPKKLHRLWYLYLFELKRKTRYFWDEILFDIGQILSILAIIIVFLEDKSQIDQTSRELLTYLVIGNVFYSMIRTISGWDVGEDDIKEGAITRKLLVPFGFLNYHFISSLTHATVSSVSFTVIFFLFNFLYKDYVIIIPENIWYLLLFLPISFIIRFLGDILAGMSAFWLTSAYGSYYLNNFVFSFLSGSLFPLAYLKSDVFLYTPFAFTFYHPMQMYLGNYSSLQSLWFFGLGIIWCIILFFLSKTVLHAGLKRNESVGL